jgi:hypothetical protein
MDNGPILGSPHQALGGDAGHHCLETGGNAREALERDLKQERIARAVLQQAIAYCIDWRETQLGLVDQPGVQNEVGFVHAEDRPRMTFRRRN